MSEETFETFDLADVLAGKKHAREVVDVWFNDELGYAIDQTSRLLARLPAGHKDIDALETELEKLKEVGKTQRFQVHVVGSDREQREAILTRVEKEFPPTKDFLGRVENNHEANTKHANLYWQLHIEKIVAPNGAVHVPTEESMALFRGKAPDSAVNAVEEAIDQLVKSTTEGFNRLKTDISFFAEPSPEG